MVLPHPFLSRRTLTLLPNSDAFDQVGLYLLQLLRMLEELLLHSCIIDVLDALIYHYVNCRDTDLPLPRRLCLNHRSVWDSFIL